jgi:hypothetical protein
MDANLRRNRVVVILDLGGIVSVVALATAKAVVVLADNKLAYRLAILWEDRVAGC